MTQCIYIIEHEKGRAYIGSTSDYDTRRSSHLSRLKAGKHPNDGLQELWKNSTPEQFTFRILEEVADASELRKHERHWMHVHNASLLNLAGIHIVLPKNLEAMNISVSLLMTKDEHTAAKDKAKEADLSLSQLVRKLLRDFVPKQ
jgi:hypothetical protein